MTADDRTHWSSLEAARQTATCTGAVAVIADRVVAELEVVAGRVVAELEMVAELEVVAGRGGGGDLAELLAVR